VFAHVDSARPEPGELPYDPTGPAYQFDAQSPLQPAAHGEPFPAPFKYPTATVHSVDDITAPDAQESMGFDSRVAGFVVECWVAESPSTGCVLADDVDTTLAEVVRGIMADPTRNGEALDTRIGNLVFFQLVQRQRLAGFEVRVDVGYRVPYTKASTQDESGGGTWGAVRRVPGGRETIGPVPPSSHTHRESPHVRP